MNDPDKFGLIMQCRQSMDEIPANELKSFAKATMDRFSTKQLKAFLFTGLYGIKKDMDYNQLFAVNTAMHEIVRKLKKKTDKQAVKNDNPAVPSAPISLTQVVPHQVLSNVVCPYLMMADITQLAQVSRAMCVIAHTPASISNLCIRHDPYRYTYEQRGYNIDGVFGFSGDLDRFRNARKMALLVRGDIRVDVLKDLRHLTCPNVQYLSLHHVCGTDDIGETASFPVLPSLKFLTVESCVSIWQIREIPLSNAIIHQLESIAFVNCLLEDVDISEEQYIADFEQVSRFFLPSQPNKLKVVKFEASQLLPDARGDLFDEWTAKLLDLDRIKTSLANLEGFAYSKPGTRDALDQFYQLSLRVLQNSQLFTRLRSIHIHDPAMIINDLYAANNQILALRPIDEICVTLSPDMLTNHAIVSSLGQICVNAKKCCFVFRMHETSRTGLTKFCRLCRCILEQSHNMNLFQIVLIVDDKAKTGNPQECAAKYQKVIEIGRDLIATFKRMSSSHSSAILAKRTLLFKFQVKSVHVHEALDALCCRDPKKDSNGFRILVTDLIMNYFLAFPHGIIQIKLSDNHRVSYYQQQAELLALQRLFDVKMKFVTGLQHLRRMSSLESPTCCKTHDFAYFAVSASAKREGNFNWKYDKRWHVDCQFCCNTPWV